MYAGIHRLMYVHPYTCLNVYIHIIHTYVLAYSMYACTYTYMKTLTNVYIYTYKYTCIQHICRHTYIQKCLPANIGDFSISGFPYFDFSEFSVYLDFYIPEFLDFQKYGNSEILRSCMLVGRQV